jgi:imidazolonepropionase-like amidohydrolase
VAIAPMLRNSLQHPAGEGDDLPFDPAEGYALIPKSLAERLRTSKPAADAGESTHARRNQQRFIKEWVAAGGALATGSGASRLGWPVPGLAIREEIALLAQAGLTPRDVLRASTAAAFEWLGAGRPWASGASADFFLVEGNPLEDLASLARTTLVVRRGVLWQPDQLLGHAHRASGRR